MEEVSDEEPTGERWDPVGESNDDEETKATVIKEGNCCERSVCVHSSDKYEAKLKSLEEEHELLNSSLCALTSHFAQVQFRLRQAVAAPYPDKESLLKSLEEFAFRGIPDVGLMRERIDEATVVEAIWLRRAQQQELIDKLKFQICELENFLYTNQQHSILENQQIHLNTIQMPTNLEFDKQKYYIKRQVEATLKHLIKPLRMKEQLVAQLKVQVADLERFIQYLQSNYNNEKKANSICICGCVSHTSIKKPLETTKNSVTIIKRIATFLHMFSLLYLGYSPQYYNKNMLNHWGDLRARLEIAISKVLDAVKVIETDVPPEQSYTSDNESFYIVNNVKVTTAVRKYLAVCIRNLIQHGACKEIPVYRLVPFMNCFKHKSKASETSIHAWEVILKYYHLKNGNQFNSTATTKLSQSFDLDITGTSGKSNKQHILFAIGNILSTHSLQKQSYDSHFKAFICAGLNANMLVKWLRMIFQCTTLLDMHYYSWSYIRKTGFSDSLSSLEILTDIKFDLPVDLSVCQLQNTDDAFV